ncbi:MAG: helix-turn-helix transcriptional regulator [Atopobiaceae bacterium]|nr:helix-turn-helix transcriptional regulator [Atopobiaceae bacterium]
MSNDEMAMREIGLRIEGLRESCDVTREEMAADLEVSLETYTQWEESGADVPISAIYHMAQRFGVEFTEILTGTAAKLNTYQVVRKGQGREVERYPGYHFEDLAFRYQNKIMQPLEVTINPSDDPAKLVQHSGQEFNLVLEGTLVVVWGDREFVLNPGDSIYFNPSIPHGQRCGGEVPARFVTVIAE